jgi:hypothetical protein
LFPSRTLGPLGRASTGLNLHRFSSCFLLLA